MDESYRSFAQATPRTGGSVPRAIWIGAGSFALGVVLIGLLWWQGLGTDDLVRVVREEPVELSAGEPAPTVSPTIAEGTARALEASERVDQVVEQQGGLDVRVAAMEQRLTRIDLQLEAATGNAARAEGLLIAFAARRAVERGTPLGYLADQLRLRFGDARPNAVQTIVEVSRDPVTLDQLIARLDGLSPQLIDSDPRGDVMGWMGRELSSLFVVRREDQPSPQPRRRIDRARLFLETGRPEAAVAEVRNLPNADEAAGWIEDAERYARAQRALELLETTAILETRGLRDGAGNLVQQPSPAGDTSNP
ncbi:MAG: hypothetical protein ACO1OD_11830 [Croceibacterium sp.]